MLGDGKDIQPVKYSWDGSQCKWVEYSLIYHVCMKSFGLFCDDAQDKDD